MKPEQLTQVQQLRGVIFEMQRQLLLLDQFAIGLLPEQKPRKKQSTAEMCDEFKKRMKRKGGK